MIDSCKKILYLLPSGDKYKLLALFVLMLLAAALEVAGIGMIPAFVAIVANPEKVMQHDTVKAILDYLGITSSRNLLIYGGLALIAVFVFKNAYISFYYYIETRYTYSRFYRISYRLMSSYMQAPYTFHLQRNTADLLRNTNIEVRLLITNVIKPCLVLAKEIVITLAITLFLLALEPIITLVVFLLLGSSVGGFLMFTHKRLKQYGKEDQVHRRDIIKALNQGVGGIKDVRVLNREAEFIEKFRYAASRSSTLIRKSVFISKIPKPIVETIAVSGVMLIALMMVFQGREIAAIIPVLALFAMATARLLPALQQITRALTQLRYNLVVVDPLYDDIQELAGHRNKFLADRKKENSVKLENAIEARSIHFKYPGSDESALDGISFTIRKGQSVAFTGPSGAGKTTIVDVLLGLLEPTKGQILLDGKNIQEQLSSWQRIIGYIPQFIYLSDETLRSNIAFGVPEKEIKDENIWKALRLAKLDEFVFQLPKGLDTIIGEHGVRLSGGQRQRVGIARALYHDPQVLVMDEATSALDNTTEKQIIKAIEQLRGERTIITIAHRLTTVMNCDVIYFMKDGKIESHGTYNELVSQNKRFRLLAGVK